MEFRDQSDYCLDFRLSLRPPSSHNFQLSLRPPSPPPPPPCEGPQLELALPFRTLLPPPPPPCDGPQLELALPFRTPWPPAPPPCDGPQLGLALPFCPPLPAPPPLPCEGQQLKSVIIPMTPAFPQTTVIPQAATSSQNLSSTTIEDSDSQSNPRRHRKKANTALIKPPYPWSTEHRAVIHELEYLRSNHILTITGDVKCKQCDKKYTMEYDLIKEFNEIASFIERNLPNLHDRAPSCWLAPVLPDCKFCKNEKCVEPVMPEEEDDNEDEDEDENNSKINWLFLLLGQMLGRLKLKQLKYFCTQTNNHRTGAKNRLLYITYLALCEQLQPSNGYFHRD